MNKTYKIPARDISLNDSYDVIIAGGGPAGCAAAIAASREGASVLLIEQSGALGGMSTGGLVPFWAPFSDGEKIVYRSIAEEVFTALKKSMPEIVDKDAVDWVSINSENLKCIYDDLVKGSGADILFNTFVTDVNMRGRYIDSIITANKQKLTAYRAKIYIDCTGDADIAAWAGCDFHKGNDKGSLQAATLCFALANVDMDEYMAHSPMHSDSSNSIMHKIVASGKYPSIKEAHMCIKPIGGDVIGINAGHIWGVDNTKPVSVSKGLIEGRKYAHELRRALAETLPEVFGKSLVVMTAPLLGVRETRRIVGDYTLNIDDYIARRTFEDEIGRNCYFVDVHRAPGEDENSPEAQQRHYGRGESHGIPYRCLIPEDADNLLVAGKCISTDRPMQGSMRVMPACLVTGEAAGRAAAIAAAHGDNTRDIDIRELRTRLIKNGAYIKLLQN
ncbi:MAG: FAD-dependent oxidoreductase [Clostridiales bacterium]|nr:FAD-dependent oxidoreductase [Clostridiales bacterium]